MEYTNNPRLKNETDLFYTGYGCTWSEDLDGKRFYLRYHPDITKNTQPPYLKLGDIIDPEARAENQGDGWDIKKGHTYIIQSVLGFQKVKILETTQYTYRIHNIDSDSKYRVSKDDFHSNNIIRERVV